MDFIEAVKALKDGRCTLARLRSVCIGFKGDILRCYHSPSDFPEHPSSTFNFHADDYTGDDWQLVNPKPQTETVTVKRWAEMYPDGTMRRYFPSQPDSDYYDPSNIIVELTGTYEAPVKPKTKRREERGHGMPRPDHVPMDAKMFYEWEE